ncbi:MAG: altronate dehydratase family protein [Bacteroidota bacterium]
MLKEILQIHPTDNVVVALVDLEGGSRILHGEETIVLAESIAQKHKITVEDVKQGGIIRMYGVVVGEAIRPIPKGHRISLENTSHRTDAARVKDIFYDWKAPNVSSLQSLTFNGYHRKDGRVGTRNFWVVVPLVFCENRNVLKVKEALETKLGYRKIDRELPDVDALVAAWRSGKSAEDVLSMDLKAIQNSNRPARLFQNIDGIKFLTHEGGCGGTRQDAETLCRLIAGYIANPNVAGATVLSLGCQNAQIELLKQSLDRVGVSQKPIYFTEQQAVDSEYAMIADAVKKTFAGCMLANKQERRPAPLSHLSLGLECGGSDGFSGISANPALGYCSDLLVALGGKSILSEFPELNGVEQELMNRCIDRSTAEKFNKLMSTYALRAEQVGSGFSYNPSPGNIKDGLITDAIKSAGAARKGGTAPIAAVLDYTEQATSSGLHLLCTPGNDVESTTGLAGSGANLIVFTTGLGTPTGNPVCPVVKMSSNSRLAQQQADLIDFDAGAIITQGTDLASEGERLLRFLIEIANGKTTKAEDMGQDDFIPWKRGISL